MAIPTYDEFMYPLLEAISDGNEYKFRDLIEILSEKFELTEEEKTELLPSGQQAIVDNRIGWAKTYLKKAGLLIYPKRARVKITERGKEVLKNNVDRIDRDYLMQFDEFEKFQTVKNQDDSENTQELKNSEEDSTPEESIERAYLAIKASLSDELLNKIMDLSPVFFERLVVDLIVKMGYGGSRKDAGRATKQSNDGGIDGIIKEDKLGLDEIYIQAKRWDQDGKVGRPEIQKFIGALAGEGAKKGIFITTAKFSRNAKEFAPRNETKVVLIDGERLTDLMIEYNLGVSTQASYSLKRLDSDYFDEE
jgi:restriction system protein